MEIESSEALEIIQKKGRACRRYLNEKCLGCPATKFYRGML